MRPTLGIDVAAPGELAWEELVDLSRWPLWGPTVRSASLDDGTVRLSAGATGSVRTVLGLRLPFEVDHWRDDAPRRTWSWRVAGVHATEHSVLETSPSTCLVQISLPWWAPAYLGAVAVALTRIRHRLEVRAED